MSTTLPTLPPVAQAIEAHGLARLMVLDLPASPEREALLSVLARQRQALLTLAGAHGPSLGTFVRELLHEAGGSPLAVVGVTPGRRGYRRQQRLHGAERVRNGDLWRAALAVHRVAENPRAVARLAALSASVALREAA